ncbi:MAG: signal peptidase II [Spirochaetaceae bacterium]|nr:MAG: signal peptidase II [Spirochaetaceae bacterium]
MKNRLIAVLLVIICILANVGIDQLSKKIAVDGLTGKGTVNVIGDVFILTLVTNEGGFLGMGEDWPRAVKLIVLQFAPLGMLLVMAVIVFVSNKLLLSERLAFAAIIGGGASNIIERLVAGEVIDFMNFGIGSFRTGILNVADLSVFFGVVALIVIMYLRNRSLKKTEPDIKPDTPASSL